MVQKEVMKKTKTYGLVGVLLAVVLVAMIYSYGVVPGVSPNFPQPSVSPTPNLIPSSEIGISPLKTFGSYDELRDFINSSNSYYVGGESRDSFGMFPIPSPVPAPTSGSVTALAPNQAGTTTDAKDYSTTNIQVAGVDEADTVKTDGKYLYVIGNNSQAVYVLDADPQNAKVLSKIFLNNTYLSGIYLSQDGQKLAVLGNQYIPYYLYSKVAAEYYSTMPAPYFYNGITFLNIYDVSVKTNPVLTRNLTMSGSYVNSRMIGNYIYDITTENAYVINGSAVLPTVFSGNQSTTIPPTRIYYANTSDTYYSYTSVIGLNIADELENIGNLTVMMGNSGSIYVSQNNIYLTYPVSIYESAPQTSPTPLPTDLNKNGANTGISMTPTIFRYAWFGTSICRIHISGTSLTIEAQGNVEGNVLNQYAMDESNNHFRIVTTSYDYTSQTQWVGSQQNNVYALDMNLSIIGKLENLGSGENFHSARFMGNRLYMVTFQKTDPLFVIDMSQPTNLRILGELIIPGYSDYLHPYDETHLIGLGKDAVVENGASFAWYQGLKLSIFDVSDVASPKETAKIIIGDRGTSSAALYDPKAFLFNASKNLLVIPVDLYLINTNASNLPERSVPATDGTTIMPISPPFIGSGSSSSQYGEFSWQGVYVFNINLDGLAVRGNVTQLDNAASLLSDPTLAKISMYPWVDYNHFISRSLYIGNVLYTFSESRVQLNSLTDFELLAKIELG